MLIRSTIVLTMLAPTPTPTLKEADAAYNAGDYRKALDLFRARAADPSVHPPEALRGVHDSLVALHGQTGQVELLCDALKVTRKMLVTGPFADAGERGAWVKLEGKDVARVKRAGVTCTPSQKKRTAAKKPALATRTDTPASSSTPAVTASSSTAAVPASADAPALDPIDTPADKTTTESHQPDDSPLLAVTGGSRPIDKPMGDVSSPVREAITLAPPPRDLDRPALVPPANTPPRRLLIAGGVTLGAGLGLTAGAGVLGGRMLDAWHESQDLHDQAGPIGTDDQADRDEALAVEYQRQRAPMLTMATVGASALVVGAVLVGVGARRLARATSRAALLPVPGGLVLRARF